MTTASDKLFQMPPRPELPPLGKLISQLREDAALRARFSLDPRSVFEEKGIDPTPYDLPDRFDGDDVDRFLSNWTGARGPTAGSRATDAAPVNEQLEKPVSQLSTATPGDPRASGDKEKLPQPPTPAPVAPVYGPPPGHRTTP
jgi:hypothetical protein